MDENANMAEHELLFEQVTEHIRVCTMILHIELSLKPYNNV
ncbi:hypothetical protein [Candidatus Enterovibrio altilux]